MSNPRNQDSIGKDKVDGVDQSKREEVEDTSRIDLFSSGGVEGSVVGIASRNEIGLTERLTDVFVDESDGDLLLQQSDREERVLQWLRALDMQVTGACRSDERLKPLLKISTSNGMAEERLLAQLSQHFEPAEVGMLARCFCIPLVSIRVGKIDKRGTLLCPTAIRGNLNLSVLATSDFRISFIGDDGHVERLFTLSSSRCGAVVVDEIPEDNSGRSFVIKIPHDQVLYFWCSEKSKLLGNEMLLKMKDLLNRRPSIAELTGISKSRLGCFATHLRAYLIGSTLVNNQRISSGWQSEMETTSAPSDAACNGQSSSASSKSLHSQHSGSLAVKAKSLGSLDHRSCSFKEVLPRTLSSLKSMGSEKFRHHGGNLTVPPSITSDASCSNKSEVDKLQTTTTGFPFSQSSSLESLGEFSCPPTLNPASKVPSMASPLFSPYYCWCPPGASNLSHLMDPSLLPIPSIESSLPIPSLSPTSMPSNLFTTTPTLSITDSPSMDFPALLPDLLSRFPISASQQIPTFTPLICDPIVHIPVIDVCSLGQGYLVSAGPTISTTIPPLHQKLVKPMIPETDSVMEKNARETLRLLINSSGQTSPPLMDVLPGVLTNADKNQSILVAGSRALYCRTRDVNVVASSIAAMGFVSLSARSTASRRSSIVNLDVQMEEVSSVSESSRSNNGSSSFETSSEKRSD